VFTQPALTVGYGSRSLAWRVPRRAGSYRVAVTAVDLVGNVGTTAGDVEVTKPKHRKRKRRGA
jgi:hypothetical protein